MLARYIQGGGAWKKQDTHEGVVMDDIKVEWQMDGEPMPGFEIGDRLLVVDPEKEIGLEEMFRNAAQEAHELDLSDEEAGRRLSLVLLESCWRGKMAGRTDELVRVSDLQTSSGAVEPSTQWFDIDAVIAILKQRKARQ